MSNDDFLSQEQIEKMLSDSGQVKNGSALAVDDFLSRDEQDVLGEVGNICMGTSATTMSTLLGRKVIITTPAVSLHTLKSLSNEYPAPIVVVEVNYTQGLTGKNLLILKDYDVALITNLLLGEEGDISPDNIELDETHLSAIREVMKGKKYLSPDITRGVLDSFVNLPRTTGTNPAFAVLTDREREALQMIAEGKSTKEIAGAMEVSVKTVETHRHNIMEKLDMHSIAELTKYAIREGVTSIDG